MGEVIQLRPRTEPWVTTGQVADHFCVSTRTVRRWVHDGAPSKRVGGLRRYHLSELERWLENQRAS